MVTRLTQWLTRLAQSLAQGLRAIALWLDPPVEDPLLVLARLAVVKADERIFNPVLARSLRFRSLARLLAAENYMRSHTALESTRNIRHAIERAMQERVG